jgi:hypothetical protein
MDFSFPVAAISLVLLIYGAALWAVVTRWLWRKVVDRPADAYPIRLVVVDGDQLKFKAG